MRLHASTRTGRGISGNNRAGAARADKIRIPKGVAKVQAKEAELLSKFVKKDWPERVIAAGPIDGLTPKAPHPLGGLIYIGLRGRECWAKNYNTWLTTRNMARKYVAARTTPPGH